MNDAMSYGSSSAKSLFTVPCKNKEAHMKVYVLRNRKTDQVIEVKAVTPVSACKYFKWRARHVEIIESYEPEAKTNKESADNE